MVPPKLAPWTAARNCGQYVSARSCSLTNALKEPLLYSSPPSGQPFAGSNDRGPGLASIPRSTS